MLGSTLLIWPIIIKKKRLLSILLNWVDELMNVKSNKNRKMSTLCKGTIKSDPETVIIQIHAKEEKEKWEV